jgi:hypothetical protein
MEPEKQPPRKLRPGSFASFEIAPGGAVGGRRKPQWALLPASGHEPAAGAGPERLHGLAVGVMRGLGRKPG